jgi:hypothetical protein
VKIEFEVLKFIEVETISWKIYMIVENCFDIVGFKEWMKIYQYSNTHTHPCCQQNMANSFTKHYQPTYCHMGSRVQVFCNHVSTLLETKKKRAASSDYLFQQHRRIQQESFRSRKVRERWCIAFLKSQICNRPMFERTPSAGAREWTCSDPCSGGYHIAHCTLHLEIWKTWSTDCFALQQKPQMELFCNSYL